MIPQSYDPITLNHWLWFKYKCHEGTATEFQHLFEEIMKRAKPEFAQIRPYGKIGDRKCDGLLFAGSTVFQVYSPDELKLEEAKRKIDEDLGGAVEHWGKDMTSWIFVHNARRGLPADIPLLLKAKKREFPQLEIDHYGNDRLWELARGLDLQQRAEILGAPAGYEHLFFANALTATEVCAVLDRAWCVIIQDVLSPIDLRAVADALQPEIPFGAPWYVRPNQDDFNWDNAKRYQEQRVSEIITRSRDVCARYAIFSMAPIPLVVHLGFLLSDRVQVRCFQHDRDAMTWQWPHRPSEEVDKDFHVSGIPAVICNEETEIVIRVSLSGPIAAVDTRAVVEGVPEIDLSVASPDLIWLQHPDQLVNLKRTFRNLLATIRERLPRCTRIHLFYYGPTGGAIVIGQSINPRMTPPVDVYQYSMQSTPRYQRAITLTE